MRGDILKPSSDVTLTSQDRRSRKLPDLLPPDLPRLITRQELRAIVPFSPQHILRLEKRGEFPRRIQIGKSRVAWLLSDVEAWIAARRTVGIS